MEERKINTGPTKIVAKGEYCICNVAVALNENWISAAEQKKGAPCRPQKLRNVLSLRKKK